jgi:hypothetical protein
MATIVPCHHPNYLTHCEHWLTGRINCEVQKHAAENMWILSPKPCPKVGRWSWGPIVIIWWSRYNTKIIQQKNDWDWISLLSLRDRRPSAYQTNVLHCSECFGVIGENDMPNSPFPSSQVASLLSTQLCAMVTRSFWLLKALLKNFVDSAWIQTLFWYYSDEEIWCEPWPLMSKTHIHNLNGLNHLTVWKMTWFICLM